VKRCPECGHDPLMILGPYCVRCTRMAIVGRYHRNRKGRGKGSRKLTPVPPLSGVCMLRPDAWSSAKEAGRQLIWPEADEQGQPIWPTA
jgi:hypothetical protein